jgi:biotin operon repressor
MRRSDRLFDIIQALRSARHPTTAVSLAERLEVSVRTVYRDIATLQARRIPIEGAPGIGYVIRGAYDLPPLTFDTEEVEAIAIGLRLDPPGAGREASASGSSRALKGCVVSLRSEAAQRARRGDLGFEWECCRPEGRRSGTDPTRDQRGAEDQNRLCRRDRSTISTCRVAAHYGLLRRRHVARGLVRTSVEFPPFPD